MKTLNVDIETFSEINLLKSGVYPYAQHESFELLLFGYAVDGGPRIVIDVLQGEQIPDDIVAALFDPDVIKRAFNANFEITCLSEHFGRPLPVEQWRCTSVLALSLGLPGNLAAVAEVCKLPVEKQKMGIGKSLIMYFCCPVKATKKNGGRTRNYPHHDPAKWALFKEYCAGDVTAEMAVCEKLIRWDLPQHEWELWFLDQRINGRGWQIDLELVTAALDLDAEIKARYTKEFFTLTGITKATLVAQLKTWLLEEHEIEMPSLNKESVKDLLKVNDDAVIERVMQLRQELSKSSTTKYAAMMRSVCAEGRIRGLFQFCGANRTWRWCLTGDHEVLTPDGWVPLDQWEGGLIACWRPATEAISFQRSKALEFDYEGELYSIDTQRCSQLSTPDHRMPYLLKDKSWGAATVEELSARRFSIPFTGRRERASSLEHSELRVLIMTQADGHYTDDGTVRFHLKKSRKIERCKTLLRRAGIVFNYMQRPDSVVIAVKPRHQPLWLRMFSDKTFGYWMLNESADVVFDEIEHWDGCRTAPNSLQYSTNNKQNADVLQALAHTTGRAATLSLRKSSDQEKWADGYYLSIWLTPGQGHEVRDKLTTSDFSGKVYCAETDTGFFMVRRNGKVWITGNSGRLVQAHNLPKSNLDHEDLILARELVKARDIEALLLLFGNIPNLLSELIRSAFIAPEGKTFAVVDYSAIEARVVAWGSGCQWRMEVFNTHGKIYEASAEQMFKLPPGSVGKKSPYRQKGKISELALGYHGGVGALITMGALKMGIAEEELQGLVDAWRAANPEIMDFGRGMEKNAKICLRQKIRTGVAGRYWFRYQSGMLFMDLPSGRSLCYVKPRIEKQGTFSNITYDGMDQVTKRWGRVDTYSGKLLENWTQAVARDCLAVGMTRMDEHYLPIVGHVHDEAIAEVWEHTAGESLSLAEEIFAQPISWAPGLPLRGDGFISNFYKKEA